MVFYNSSGIFAAYGGRNEVMITMPLNMDPGYIIYCILKYIQWIIYILNSIDEHVE